uniref:ATP synthase F0 subunit 8 n=1 Tax=Oncopsis nigrofasciata TaxID=2689619 RepID=A0A6B9ITE9_9HEMI|nr:ATP synthase F0 subunit 8 [Oncopsis nigrofasciata]
MPQMAPMWWLTLEIMFSASFMLIMIMMYFNMKINMKKTNKIFMKKIKWMW